MHLVESYSLNIGQPIDEPVLWDSFYPSPKDKYITFHPQSKPSKNYQHWQEVIDFLLPYLNQHDIAIVQLGASEDPKFAGCHHVCGMTNLNQAAFLIKNSLLHLSTDTFSAHVAGHYRIPLVALYSNNYINNVKPYWLNDEKSRLFYPVADNEKPCLGMVDPKMVINRINPAEIAAAVLDLLGITHTLGGLKLLYRGSLYGNVVVEMFPTKTVNLFKYGLANIVVRMDYHWDENVLIEQANMSPVIAYLDRPLSISTLFNINRANLQKAFYIVRDCSEETMSFMRLAARFGIGIIPLMDAAQCSDPDAVRFAFAPFCVLNNVAVPPPSTIERLQQAGNNSTIFYKTSRFIIKGDSIYPSKSALEKQLTTSSFRSTLIEIGRDVDFSKFANDLEHLIIYSQA